MGFLESGPGGGFTGVEKSKPFQATIGQPRFKHDSRLRLELKVPFSDTPIILYLMDLTVRPSGSMNRLKVDAVPTLSTLLLNWLDNLLLASANAAGVRTV